MLCASVLRMRRYSGLLCVAEYRGPAYGFDTAAGRETVRHIKEHISTLQQSRSDPYPCYTMPDGQVSRQVMYAAVCTHTMFGKVKAHTAGGHKHAQSVQQVNIWCFHLWFHMLVLSMLIQLRHHHILMAKLCVHQVIGITGLDHSLSDIVFEPWLLGHGFQSQQGITQVVYDAIMSCDTDIRSELFSNVVLSGGNTMFPGEAHVACASTTCCVTL